MDKILRGAKPGDLPVEQPTKVDLTVNLRTAKALGIPTPSAIMVRAGRLIEWRGAELPHPADALMCAADARRSPGRE